MQRRQQAAARLQQRVRARAAATIQTAWRLHALRQLQGLFASIIQAAWRRHAARSAFLAARAAACRIQAGWRGCVARVRDI